jgi:hypothetical protein
MKSGSLKKQQQPISKKGIKSPVFYPLFSIHLEYLFYNSVVWSQERVFPKIPEGIRMIGASASVRTVLFTRTVLSKYFPW